MRRRLKSMTDSIRRRFGVAAPRVVVRAHFSYGLFILFAIALLFGGVLVGYFIATESRGSAGEFDLLQARFRQQNEEVERLSSLFGVGESASNMERAAQQQLLGKISLLEEENRKLKEDLLLLEKLVPGAGGVGRVRIENFKIVRNAGALPRYVFLLAYIPAKPGVEFRGRLQLVVTYSLAGREFRVAYPQSSSRSSDYDLEVRHSVRKEGVLDLPNGAELRSVEAMVLQGDSLRAKSQAVL